MAAFNLYHFVLTCSLWTVLIGTVKAADPIPKQGLNPSIQKLSSAQVSEALKQLKPSGWTEANNAIERKLEFHSFPEAISFLVKLAMKSSEMNHQKNVGSQISIKLSTKEAKGLTKNDIDLAKYINEITKK